MELILVARVLARRWYLVLIPVVIVAVFVVPDFIGDGPAVSGGYTTTMRYTAAQQLDAVPDRQGDLEDIWIASEKTVNAFTDWVRAGRFAEAVADVAAEQGLQLAPAALQIQADNSRSVGQITLNWPDAAQLQIIADAAAEVLQNRNHEVWPQLGDVPAYVELLDDPHIVAAPPPLVDRLEPLVRLGLALLAGIGIAFLVEYLDPTVHNREDVESLGVRVIATIPRR